MPVRTRRVDDVPVIEVDNPPVSACSIHVRRGLLEAMRTVRDPPDLGRHEGLEGHRRDQ